jgi:multidrug efflux system outer membrane protein
MFPFLSSYRAAPPGAPVLLKNEEWWLRLQDPTLNRLVALALQDSLTLERARERVVQARSERREVPLAATINASAGAQLEGNGDNSPDITGTGRIGPAWLLDPWGGRRAQIRAAGARIEVAGAEVNAAQLLLLLNLGNAYVDLRLQQRLLALRLQELRGREQTLETTRTMIAAGAATRLEALRAEARLEDIRADLPGLRAQIAGLKNQIAVLAGRAPGALPAGLSAALERVGAQPRPDLAPDVGIPADLLRNRPDIRIKERSYYAALADVGVARAALYPRLSLTGAITFNALERSGSGTNYYLGPSIQLPAIPGDNAYAAVDTRQSQVRQALTEWQSTVLDALLEVENALLDYTAVSGSIRAAQRAARLHGEALDLTRTVFAQQNATLTDLIEAEQARAEADRTVAETLARRARSFVALNVALGSGHAATRQDGPDRTTPDGGADRPGRRASAQGALPPTLSAAPRR